MDFSRQHSRSTSVLDFVNDLPASLMSTLVMYIEKCIKHNIISTYSDCVSLHEDLNSLLNGVQLGISSSMKEKAVLVESISSYDNILCMLISSTDIHTDLGVIISADFQWKSLTTNTCIIHS